MTENEGLLLSVVLFNNLVILLKDLLSEIEKLVSDLKQALDSDKMSLLTQKAEQATENVEEAESLVNKLETEIIEWNAVKKLTKRDSELEEVAQQCSELFEDLTQEKSNTEVELEKNQEKQDENKD